MNCVQSSYNVWSFCSTNVLWILSMQGWQLWWRKQLRSRRGWSCTVPRSSTRMGDGEEFLYGDSRCSIRGSSPGRTILFEELKEPTQSSKIEKASRVFYHKGNESWSALVERSLVKKLTHFQILLESESCDHNLKCCSWVRVICKGLLRPQPGNRHKLLNF